MGIPTVKISDSVGDNAKNNDADVKIVRGILKEISTALSDKRYEPGTDTQSLIKAIKAFQKHLLLKNLNNPFPPDGNVSTGGRTWRGLRWFKDLQTITLKRESKLNSDYSLNGTLTVAGTNFYTIEQPYDQTTHKKQNWFPSGRWLLCHSWKWSGGSKAALRPAWVGNAGTPNTTVLIHYAHKNSSYQLEGCLAPGTSQKTSKEGISGSKEAMDQLFTKLGGYRQHETDFKKGGWVQGQPGGKVVVLYAQNGIPEKAKRKSKERPSVKKAIPKKASTKKTTIKK